MAKADLFVDEFVDEDKPEERQMGKAKALIVLTE